MAAAGGLSMQWFPPVGTIPATIPASDGGGGRFMS